MPILQCIVCGKKFSDGVNAFIPVDPKGTKERRWVCDECSTDVVVDSLPKDVKDLISIINPSAKFLEDCEIESRTSRYLTIENVSVHGLFEAARGMRNPMNSWDKSDTDFNREGGPTAIGPEDLKLMSKLVRAGNDHSKFMRFIHVYADITAPTYWWLEFDTYKVGTVSNSCSKMHTIHKRPLTLEDFTIENTTWEYNEALENAIEAFNKCREEFVNYEKIEDGSDGYSEQQLFRSMVGMLPMSFKQKRTVDLNYQVLRNMYKNRRNHKLAEWREFCEEFILFLPYADRLITI